MKTKTPHIAFKDDTLTDLFEHIAQASRMYAHESVTEWKDMHTKPQAMEYRVKVIQQFVDEISARANELK